MATVSLKYLEMDALYKESYLGNETYIRVSGLLRGMLFFKQDLEASI